MRTKIHRKQVSRKQKKTRKQRGGEQYLRLQYTKNPGRAAWVEAVYPLGPSFFKLIDTIPWADYKFEGTTEGMLIQKSSEETENTAEIEWQRDVPITAKTFRVPYVVLGGAACEIYNLHYTQTDAPRLEATTDPTGDIDCKLANLTIAYDKASLFSPTNIDAIDKIGSKQLVFPYIIEEQGLKRFSALYDNYSRWLFERVCEKLEPLQQLVAATPKFAPKPLEGNTETEIADYHRYIGNFLVTRARVSNMLKIQVGLGVKYGNEIKGDHCIEFILPIEEDIKELSLQQLGDQSELARNVTRIEPLSTKFPFGINVLLLKTLINDQAAALVSRGKEFTNEAKTRKNRNERNYQEFSNAIAHKSYNHYGRLIYLLELLLYLINHGLHPVVSRSEFYLMERDLIRNSQLNRKNVQACFPRCDFGRITTLLNQITAYRPSRR